MTASARFACRSVRETNGAKAISAAPNRLAPIAAQVSTEPSPSSSPESTGATANANVPIAGRRGTRREQQIHRAPLDEESGRGEHRDHRGHDGDRGVERDARIRERVAVEPAREKSRTVPIASTQTRSSSPMSHERYLSDGRVVTSP